jgi:hypothetical protein
MTNHDVSNGPAADPGAHTSQRSPRTDPDLRDGDSGSGNPLESGPGPVTTDNDIGDTRPSLSADQGAEIERTREEVVGTGLGESSAPSAGAAARGDAPIPGYQQLTVPEIIRQAGTMTIDQLREVKDYEKSHRRRKTLLTKLERMLRGPRVEGGRSGPDAGPGPQNP